MNNNWEDEYEWEEDDEMGDEDFFFMEDSDHR